MERSFDSPAPLPHPPGEPRTRFDDRLSRLLTAATEVIARDGYEKASMRQVAHAAGTSLAGMYHYFGGKERMLFLIQFRTFNALLNGLKERLHDARDPVERLRVMIRNHVDYFAANMAALKVCSHELDLLTGEAYQETHRIRREYYELTRDIVATVIPPRARRLAPDVHLATMLLFGTLNWLYRWYDPRRDKAPAALAQQITAQFLQGVRGSARAKAAPARAPRGVRRRVRTRAFKGAKAAR